MIDMWINFGDGFVLVFALNDEESFKILDRKRERILKTKKDTDGNPPILLVGNKQDLEKERVISYTEGKMKADSWKSEYIETSAKTNFNYKEAFEKITTKIIEKRKDIRVNSIRLNDKNEIEILSENEIQIYTLD